MAFVLRDSSRIHHMYSFGVRVSRSTEQLIKIWRNT